MLDGDRDNALAVEFLLCQAHDARTGIDELESLANYIADKKQKREKLADKYLGDEAKPKNSLASRLIKQEKSK